MKFAVQRWVPSENDCNDPAASDFDIRTVNTLETRRPSLWRVVQRLRTEGISDMSGPVFSFLYAYFTFLCGKGSFKSVEFNHAQLPFARAHSFIEAIEHAKIECFSAWWLGVGEGDMYRKFAHPFIPFGGSTGNECGPWEVTSPKDEHRQCAVTLYCGESGSGKTACVLRYARGVNFGIYIRAADLMVCDMEVVDDNSKKDAAAAAAWDFVEKKAFAMLSATLSKYTHKTSALMYRGISSHVLRSSDVLWFPTATP
jgi:hypothetical protein